MVIPGATMERTVTNVNEHQRTTTSALVDPLAAEIPVFFIDFAAVRRMISPLSYASHNLYSGGESIRRPGPNRGNVQWARIQYR
jgi:hypothetical protein